MTEMEILSVLTKPDSKKQQYRSKKTPGLVYLFTKEIGGRKLCVAADPLQGRLFRRNRLLEMKETIIVHTDKPPTVEIDSTVPAAYIRFSEAKVVSTQPIDSDDMIINVDLDQAERVVGVELVGVDQFNITELAERAHVIGIPDEFLRRTRYVPALQPA